MNQLNIAKALAYGAFLWLIITALIGSVYGFGLYFDRVDSPWIGIIAAFVAGGIAAIFAKEVGIADSKKAGVYSLFWLIIPVLLDFIIIARLTSGIFSSWQYWFGHTLVFLAPWLIFQVSQKNK